MDSTTVKHLGGRPDLCCLPGSWDRATIHDIMSWGEPLPPEVADTAAAGGVDPHALDRHVAVVHGWEPHDTGYAERVIESVACLRRGDCK